MDSQNFEMIVKLIYGILIFACLIFLAYIVTKYIGKKTMSNMKNKHIQVIEWVSLGVDKSIYLLEIGEKNILIGISGKNINYLTEVEIKKQKEETLDKTEKQFKVTELFSNYLNSFLNETKGNSYKEKKETEKEGSPKNLVALNIEKIKGTIKDLKNKDGNKDDNVNG